MYICRESLLSSHPPTHPPTGRGGKRRGEGSFNYPPTHPPIYLNEHSWDDGEVDGGRGRGGGGGLGGWVGGWVRKGLLNSSSSCRSRRNRVGGWVDEGTWVRDSSPPPTPERTEASDRVGDWVGG